MDIAEMNVKIGADIAVIQAALAKLNQDFATTAGSIGKMGPVLDQAAKNLAQVTTASAATSGGISAISKAATNTSFITRQATQNISNVFRDLPFAINNPAILPTAIDHVIASMNMLKGVAGEGKSAMALVAESLSGPGGVLVAVSLAGSALSLLSGFFGANKAAVDDGIKSNQDYAKSLNDIQLGKIGDAEKSIANIELLSKTVQDNTVAINDRLTAANKLQEDSGYFAALTKEQILYGNITQAVNDTRTAILQKALSDAAGGKAGEAAGQQYLIYIKLQDALKQTIDLQNKYDQAQETNFSGTNPFESALKAAQENVAELDVQYTKAGNDVNRFLNDATNFSKLVPPVDQAAIVMRKLNDEIDVLNQKTIDTGGNFDKDKISDYKKAVDDLLALPQNSETQKDIQELVDKVKALGGSFDDSAVKAKKAKETISDVMSGLYKELGSLNNIQLNVKGADETQAKINLIEAAIKKLQTGFNLPDNSPIIQSLLFSIDQQKFDSIAQLNDYVKKKINPDLEATYKIRPDLNPEAAPYVPYDVELHPVFDKDAFQDIINRAQVELDANRLHLDVDTSHFSGNEISTLLKPLNDITQANNTLMYQFGIGLPADVKKSFDAFKNLALAKTELVDLYNLSDKLAEQYSGKLPKAIQLYINAANKAAEAGDSKGVEKGIAQLNGLYEANKGLTDFINNVTIGAFEDLGTAIGTALAGKNANLFGSFLNTIGEVLKSLGDTMIKAGVEMLAIKLAFKSVNPVLAIAAGVALEALGTFVESKAPKLAEGGIIPPGFLGDTYPALLSSGEIVLPPSKLDTLFNSIDYSRNMNMHVTGEFRVSGNNLVAAVSKAVPTFNKTFGTVKFGK